MSLVAAAACGRQEPPKDAIPPPAVETVAVRMPQAEGSLTATGLLERRREMTLSFRIPGVLTQLAVDDGDSVRAGQVLAAIDPSGVAAAEARAGVDVERARRDLARDQALFDRGFVSAQRLDDRKSALKSAQAGAGAAAFDRRWARLVSPASGVVLQRLAQAGEVVQPGQAVLRIADESSPLTLRAPLADRDVSRVRPGQSASVRIDGLPAVVPGRVTRVGERSGAQTGAVDVEIEILGGTGLRSGQVATARIAVPAPNGPALARVPAEAILEAKGRQAFVLVADRGVARRRAVTFGGFSGDDALVDGLAAGSRVITAGAGFVGDGDKITVVDPSRIETSLPGGAGR
ncbi:efflux RND transporter periplasmic adaptor subunit [Phenylobacterium sp.]|uniref:efflux RND transporter periplasmic adaptor subunit n=1 Tax=Phenylobacterium sp. TaxID=1871053 RepID=UPI00286C0BA3|nr:efflux RND transporter periplasmic adaptor subunit [Phenylobacterium sp.]